MELSQFLRRRISEVEENGLKRYGVGIVDYMHIGSLLDSKIMTVTPSTINCV